MHVWNDEGGIINCFKEATFHVRLRCASVACSQEEFREYIVLTERVWNNFPHKFKPLWVSCFVEEKSKCEARINISLEFWKARELRMESSISSENLNRSLMRVLEITIPWPLTKLLKAGNPSTVMKKDYNRRV